MHYNIDYAKHMTWNVCHLAYKVSASLLIDSGECHTKCINYNKTK